MTGNHSNPEKPPLASFDAAKAKLIAAWADVTTFSSSFWNSLNGVERIVLFVGAIVASIVALSFEWTSKWPLGFHSDWGLAYATLAFALFVLLFSRLVQHQEPVRHGLEGVAALLTSIAIVGAGYWFFYERPGVPKVNVITTTQAWPIGDGQALVRVSLNIQNVGSTVVNFERHRFTPDLCKKREKKCVDQRTKVDLGQVKPVPLNHKDTKEMIDNFVAQHAEGAPEFEMKRTYKWPPLARWYWLPEGEIEAGETEKHYFKAIVPCADGLVLASTARVFKIQPSIGRSKKGPSNLIWVGQSISEPIEKCL